MTSPRPPYECTKCGRSSIDFIPVYGQNGHNEVIIVSWKCPTCYPDLSALDADPLHFAETADEFVRSKSERRSGNAQ